MSSPEPSNQPSTPLWRRLLLPVLVGGAIAAGFIAMRIELRSQEDYHAYLIGQAEGARARSEFAAKLDERRDALTEFAAEWSRRANPTEAEWTAAAAAFLKRDLEYRAIEWREPSLAVRWAEPQTARLPTGPLDPQDDALRQSAINTVEEAPTTSVPASYSIGDGTRQLLVCAPMAAGDRRSGYLIGVMRVRDLIDAVARDGIQRGFEISAYEGPFWLFGPLWEDSGHPGSFWYDAVVNWSGVSFTFKVWPSAAVVQQLRSPVPDIMLVIGLALAAAFGLLLYGTENATAGRPRGE